MFTPSLYQDADPAHLRTVIDDNPLALLATNGDERPHLTHLPAIVPAGTAPGEVGPRLLCHLNRHNPHWSALREGQQAVLTFDGAGGYVSPATYPTGPAAPTWNFVSVEITGRIHLLTGEEATLGVVRATADALESRFGAGWDQDASVDYFRQLLPAVGALEVLVEDVGAMFKLSQEKSPQIQENVIRRLEQGRHANEHDLAVAMRANGCGLLS